ncbi:COX15/CtaA family protein [Rhizobium sp. Leaf262]|uniref:COX15/CtaA family protein n=1 Tax=Rhizobium sp. Leaf262 TaxID=1736312 RepID=UPI00071517DE|nr:COX15/CtaA family protein [Rhizobium sp. Leaf262]KQO76826.1 heme A synthase [Rhizobium sp. Leaf262]
MQANTVAAAEISVEQRREAALKKLEKDRRLVRIWLRVVLFVLFCLVLVGGATRLTESGLSITEWKPIHGAIPPLSVAEWEEEFQLYKRIPQYQEINKGMSLEEFKTIFWWEWAHRLLARAIGLIFALPLAYFWLTGRIEKRLRLPLVGLLALGGLQGFVGWWMVSSGLVNRTDVSQYRLATHLTIACLIFAGCMWILRGLSLHSAHVASIKGRRFAALLAILCLVQIYLGALVAGLNAGLSYNTWPLMDGSLVPGDLFLQQPWWINLFENPKTVQFVHRLGAYVLIALTLWNMIVMTRSQPNTPHARRSVLFFVLICIQAGLGITTLLMHVDIHVALAHQGMALLVLAFAIANWRGFVGEYPVSITPEVRG